MRGQVSPLVLIRYTFCWWADSIPSLVQSSKAMDTDHWADFYETISAMFMYADMHHYAKFGIKNYLLN